MRHIQIVDPTQLYPETGLRRECIERIAIGLDMPPEILLGLADANHWRRGRSTSRRGRPPAPVAQQLCDDLTASFYRPTLKREGSRLARYAIGYDATDVINHPDKSKNAVLLHDRGAISLKSLRDSSGFTEADAPSDEERAQWVGVKVGDAGLALTGEPTEAPPPEPPPPPPPAEEPPAGTPGGTAEEPPPGSEVASANGHTAALWRIVGASDLAVLRCREVAGNKLRNLAKRDRDLERELEGVPARDVPGVLGLERATQLGAPSAQVLVTGTEPMILDALRVFAVNGDVAAQVAARVSQHAARNLYAEKPVPLPRQYESYVLGLLRAAG
jgi:hypothetical protein